MAEEKSLNAIELATELTIAWLGSPNVRATAEDVPAFLRTIYATISELSGDPGSGASEQTASGKEPNFVPAVSIRKSLGSKEYILSLIDGKPYKTLRRHLSGHGLSPEQYRERYSLRPDYPMVSEAYSASRRAMAHRIGLGRKDRTVEAVAAPAPKKRAPRRARRDA